MFDYSILLTFRRDKNSSVDILSTLKINEIPLELLKLRLN